MAGFASSDEANAVTKNLTLPYKLKNDSGATKSWSSVSWISSDTAVVKVSGSGWSDSTGAVTRTAADRAVTLTATVSAGGISSSGGPSTTVEKSFDVTVKGDPDKVAAEKAAFPFVVEDERQVVGVGVEIFTEVDDFFGIVERIVDEIIVETAE